MLIKLRPVGCGLVAHAISMEHVISSIVPSLLTELLGYYISDQSQKDYLYVIPVITRPALIQRIYSWERILIM